MTGAASSGAERHFRALESLYASAPVNALFDSHLEITGEGAVMIDGSQTPPAVSAGDDAADVTISADADVFAEMMQGELDPTGAYMSGKLSIDGDMGLAMKLAQLLA